MMSTLITYQQDDGMWHQLLDDPESYPEASCTGMFIYALATGLDYGWLEFDQYSPVVATGWDALAGYVDEKGRTENVCNWDQCKKLERALPHTSNQNR